MSRACRQTDEANSEAGPKGRQMQLSWCKLQALRNRIQQTLLYMSFEKTHMQETLLDGRMAN